MRTELAMKILALIFLILIAIPLSMNFAGVSDSFLSGSDPARRARFYFCILVGLGILIIQNIFLRRALRDSELTPGERWEKKI